MAYRRPRIELARAYDVPEPDGRYRVLVDRLWPRGVKKDELQLDAWLKELAPSTALRHWFGHDPERWDEFRERYFAELKCKPEDLAELFKSAAGQSLLLLYGAHDNKHNNAVALKEYLEKRAAKKET